MTAVSRYSHTVKTSVYYLHACHVTITQTHVHTLDVARYTNINVGLMLMVISDHATKIDARIDSKVFVHVLTHR